MTWKRLVPALLLAAFPVGAQTADELAVRNIEAKGGKAALEAVKSVRLIGTLNQQMGLRKTEASIVVELIPPSRKARIEVTSDGELAVLAYDGARGWIAEGNGAPKDMSGAELGNIRRTADFGGLLYEPAARGRHVELVGKATVNGTDAYELRVTTSDGTQARVYLAADTFLEIKEDWLGEGATGKVHAVTTISDFRKVRDLTLPFSTSTATTGLDKDSPATIWNRVQWDKIELNVNVPDSRFEKPGAGGK